MTLQSSLLFAALAGVSVAGAAVGVHREAIVDQAEDVFQAIAFSGPTPEVLPKRIVLAEAAPNILAVSPLPLTPPETYGRVPDALVPAPVKFDRTIPKISKIAVPSPDFPGVTSPDMEAQAPELSAPSFETADLEGLTAVELMRKAAKEKPTSNPSQLDIILSSMRTVEKEETLIPEVVERVMEAGPDGPHEKQVEKIVEIASSAARAKPAMRPGAGEEGQAENREQPAYSAKHYHHLRYHLNGRNRKSQIACVAELRLIASYTQVYFDIGSSVLDGRGASAARLVAAKAQSCPEAQVSIIGFTDPGGSDELNKRISWSRANGVFRSIEEAGFSTKNIEVSSHMEDHPEDCIHFEGIDRRVVFDIREVSSL